MLAKLEIVKTEKKEVTFEEEIERRIVFYRELAEKLKVPVSEVTAAVIANELFWINMKLIDMHEHLDKHFPLEAKDAIKNGE